MFVYQRVSWGTEGKLLEILWGYSSISWVIKTREITLQMWRFNYHLMNAF